MEHIIVARAGIVGLSTAIWLQRSGYQVSLLDKEGPASGLSYGNAGVLASGAILPVTTPGLLRSVPVMLLDKDKPLFLRYSYLPKLLPFLARYLPKATDIAVDAYIDGITPLIRDSVDQHQALAKGTGAEIYIEERNYCYGYQTKSAFEADAYGWRKRAKQGYEFEVCSQSDYAAYDPLFDGQFETIVRCRNHGIITDPGG